MLSPSTQESDLKAWTGRERVLREVIAAEPAERLAAVLDLPDVPAEAGTVPPGWHWLHFLPAVPAAGIDTDGHAKRGDFLPPVTKRYRMFAGSRISWQRPLRIGRQAELRERITAVEVKPGRAGVLVFVSVKRSIRQSRRQCLTELQTLVFHDGIGSQAAPPADPPPFSPEWVEHCAVDRVALFRFSAVTFNAHRIHYDRDYARDAERYPGLVVHGPLLALMLLGASRRRYGDVLEYSFRAQRPLFDHQRFELHGRREAEQARLCVRASDGYTAMQASATFR